MILIPISDTHIDDIDDMILTSAFPGIDKLEIFKFIWIKENTITKTVA